MFSDDSVDVSFASMASLLVAVKGAKSFLGETEPSIDNWTFRLFYKVIFG